MKKLIALALSLPMFAGAAHAQGANPYKLATVCKFDIEQYCKGIKSSQTKRIKECLAQHEKELYPRCQDHYKEAHQ